MSEPVFKLSALLGSRIVDESGSELGEVEDVRVRRAGDDALEVVALLYGRDGMRARIGLSGNDGEEPAPVETLVAWSDVVAFEDGVVRVRRGAA